MQWIQSLYQRQGTYEELSARCKTTALFSGGALVVRLLPSNTGALLKRLNSLPLEQWGAGDWIFTAWLTGSAALFVWTLYVQCGLKKTGKNRLAVHIEDAQNRIDRAEKAAGPFERSDGMDSEAAPRGRRSYHCSGYASS